MLRNPPPRLTKKFSKLIRGDVLAQDVASDELDWGFMVSEC